MNLLLISPSYPHPAAESAGAHNERSALALRRIVNRLEVVTPRPFAPWPARYIERWKSYVHEPKEQFRNGLHVHRPGYPLIPKLCQAFWPATAAFAFCRRMVRRLHQQIGFDAILSFDLSMTGGLAWRLGHDLRIPACGWATGSDIRWHAHTPIGQSVRRTLQELDLVFYQSAELKAVAAELLGTHAEHLAQHKHVIQSRGVSLPPRMPGVELRRSLRSQLHIDEHDVVLLYLGRIVRDKGLFELVDGFAAWSDARRLRLVLVGARPGHDETAELENRIRSLSLSEFVRILPGCEPDRVWDYLSIADIFTFPSFKEGMPNSLLEAMLAGLPAVAFSIPSVQEIGRHGPGLIAVPPYDFEAFGRAVLELAADARLRTEIGGRARAIVQENFSLTHNMQTVIDHIRSLGAG